MLNIFHFIHEGTDAWRHLSALPHIRFTISIIISCLNKPTGMHYTQPQRNFHSTNLHLEEKVRKLILPTINVPKDIGTKEMTENIQLPMPLIGRPKSLSYNERFLASDIFCTLLLLCRVGLLSCTYGCL